MTSQPKIGELAVASALVVEPHLGNLLFVLSTLSSVGFDVTVAHTFKDGKSAIAAARPSLLLTDIRLHEYNGLHLVLRARDLWSQLPVIVISEVDDRVLQHEAEQLGATFVTLPTPKPELIAAVIRTMLAGPDSQLPLRPPFERRRGERRVLAGGKTPDRRAQERRRDLALALRDQAADR